MSAEYMTLDECAKRGGFSRTTILELIKHEGLPCIVITPRLKRIPVAEFDAWMRKFMQVKGSIGSAAVKAAEEFLEIVRVK